MSGKFKPIVYKDEHHTPAVDKIDGGLFDVKDLISTDAGNALEGDLGLYYSRCACTSYRYTVVSTHPYPVFFKGVYSSGMKPLKTKKLNVVKSASSEDALAVQTGVTAVSVKTVTGYKESEQTPTSGVSVHTGVSGVKVKSVTGYKESPETYIDSLTHRTSVAEVKLVTRVATYSTSETVGSKLIPVRLKRVTKS